MAAAPFLCAGASAVAIAEVITLNIATKYISDFMNVEWNGPPDTKEHFRQLAENRATLGFDKDLERPTYAKSPLLRRLEELPLGKGIVYVAYFPPGNGKTTACRAFLRAFKRNPRGIAFCPSQAPPPYAGEMLRLLGLDADNPPNGWLSCLKDAIQTRDEQTYLLLDDFMNRGSNELDGDLIASIQSKIRGSDITAIVLTHNQQAADYLLTLNGLKGIKPLLSLADTDILRTRNPPKMDWETDMSMEWSTNDLKHAAAVDPRNKHMKKKKLHNRIDKFLARMTKEERKKVDPLSIAEMLDAPPAQEQNECFKVRRISGPYLATHQDVGHQDVGAGCGECRIL
jgi:hypothetical protein